MPIKFYRPTDDYGCFSNFSRHPVKLDDKIWKTSEHYFQAQKFIHSSKDMNDVFKANSPSIAARIGRDRKRPLRKDWESVKDDVMHRVVKAKVLQHKEIKELLLSTGNEEIIEHTKNDRYWGDGGDGRGKNMLGKTLMRVREELKKSEQ